MKNPLRITIHEVENGYVVDSGTLVDRYGMSDRMWVAGTIAQLRDLVCDLASNAMIDRDREKAKKDPRND